MADTEADDYAANVNSIVSNGFVCMAISLGTNVGLFKKLIELEEPVDCQTLSDLTSLRERYVREWLGCMVAAKIIYMEGDNKYYIPSEHKKDLDMVVYAPAMTMLAGRQASIEALFRKTSEDKEKKGIDMYGEADLGNDFYDWQDREWEHSEVNRIDNAILPTLKKYKDLDKINQVMDVGCGGGVLVTALAKRFPKATITGIDNSDIALEKAKAFSKEKNALNTEYFSHDVASLPANWENKFDFIILFDVLHDLPNPTASISEVKRALKDDGVIMCIDPKVSSHHRKNIGDPNASFCLAFSIYCCLPNSLHKGEAAGLGVGWGMENEEEFLSSHLNVVEISNFHANECSNNFVCLKK